MGQKSIPTPVVAGIIAALVIMVAFFLYKGATGGTVTNGSDPNGQASPPMPEAAKQQMQQMQQH